ncbi:MAG TPA: DarT ssDNA thymidine ADP-ribosyltransferase family protein [Candidatus Limnocylindrales bacterium]|nr:DarT ssDNA thymidine ADP-ribosyltransferase family protein [Candidatus Limnocylindrales bacterium]
MTHLANLDRIFDTGELRPSVGGEGAEGAEPAIDVSSATARELRSTTEVVDQRSVAQYVPFYLSPDATRWDELRTGGTGVHWSDDARASTAADYVVLVAPLSELGPDTAIAGGDAAGPVTRFALGDEENLRMLRRLHAEGGPLNDAEALAVDPVAVTSFALIGVANDPIRDRVRAMLRSAGLTIKVSVYPPWFQPAEEE